MDELCSRLHPSLKQEFCSHQSSLSLLHLEFSFYHGSFMRIKHAVISLILTKFLKNEAFWFSFQLLRNFSSFFSKTLERIVYAICLQFLLFCNACFHECHGDLNYVGWSRPSLKDKHTLPPKLERNIFWLLLFNYKIPPNSLQKQLLLRITLKDGSNFSSYDVQIHILKVANKYLKTFSKNIQPQSPSFPLETNKFWYHSKNGGQLWEKTISHARKYQKVHWNYNPTSHL